MNITNRDVMYYMALMFIAVSIQMAGCSVRYGLSDLAQQKEYVR